MLFKLILSHILILFFKSWVYSLNTAFKITNLKWEKLEKTQILLLGIGIRVCVVELKLMHFSISKAVENAFILKRSWRNLLFLSNTSDIKGFSPPPCFASASLFSSLFSFFRFPFLFPSYSSSSFLSFNIL